MQTECGLTGIGIPFLQRRKGVEIKILFVDDSEFKCDVCTGAIRRELTKNGGLRDSDIRIYTANDYDSAVEIYEHNLINIVITDRMMPGKDGSALGGDDLVMYLKQRSYKLPNIIVISGMQVDLASNTICSYEREGIQYVVRGSGELADSQILAAKVLNIVRKELSKNGTFKYKNFELTPNTGVIRYEDKTTCISTLQTKLLSVIIEKTLNGSIAEYEEIYNSIYPNEENGYDISAKERIAQIVSSIKKAMELVTENITIKSSRGRGYYVV